MKYSNNFQEFLTQVDVSFKNNRRKARFFSLLDGEEFQTVSSTAPLDDDDIEHYWKDIHGYLGIEERLYESEVIRLIKEIEIETEHGTEKLCICRVNGALVGIDASFVENNEDDIVSPYNGQRYPYSEDVKEDIKVTVDARAFGIKVHEEFFKRIKDIPLGEYALEIIPNKLDIAGDIEFIEYEDPKIFITVKGGTIQEIRSKINMEVTINDLDLESTPEGWEQMTQGTKNIY